MSISSSMSIASSALSAFGAGMQTTTHNVANVNTAGFNPQRAEYSDISGNNGTRLDAVFQGEDFFQPVLCCLVNAVLIDHIHFILKDPAVSFIADFVRLRIDLIFRFRSLRRRRPCPQDSDRSYSRCSQESQTF